MFFIWQSSPLALNVCTHAQLLQSCLTLCDPMDSSPPDSVHGILQAKIVEWAAVPSSRESSWSRDQTHISWVSCIAGVFFTTELPGKPISTQYILAIKLIAAFSYSSLLPYSIVPSLGNLWPFGFCSYLFLFSGISLVQSLVHCMNTSPNITSTKSLPLGLVFSWEWSTLSHPKEVQALVVRDGHDLE